MPPSCALLGGFAIGARVALLWQHNANPSYKLACTPRHDNRVRTRNVSKCSVLALCLVKLVKVFSAFFIYFLLYCCIVSTIMVNKDDYNIRL